MFQGSLISKLKFIAFAAIAVIGLSFAAQPASAQWGSGYGGYGGYGGGYGGYGSGYGGYSQGGYHSPSMHYDRQFHGSSHWTPFRGYHSHGHYDNVPHYVPGHSHGGYRW